MVIQAMFQNILQTYRRELEVLEASRLYTDHLILSKRLANLQKQFDKVDLECSRYYTDNLVLRKNIADLQKKFDKGGLERSRLYTENLILRNAILVAIAGIFLVACRH